MRHGDRGRIVLGVTSAVSLRLMNGHPAHLAEVGWDVHVVLPSARATVAGATVHGVPMVRDPSPVADARSLWSWYRLLGALRPDCVMVGTPKAGLLGVLAAWLRRTPRRVYHLRGLRLEGETGLRFSLLWLLEFVACRLATDVLAVSDSLRQRAVGLGLVSRRSAVVLGRGSSNGVSLEEFFPDPSQSTRRRARRDLGLSDNAYVVGFVGRVHPHKGLATLADAFIGLDGDERPVLVVFGAVEDQSYADRARQSLEGAGVPAVFAGQVDNLRDAYCAMDVLALPSAREGFPNVVLEAAACGVPSIVTDVTGCRDAVMDGQTGWIVPFGDEGALRSAIEAAQDSRKRAAAGAAAHAMVRSHYERRSFWALIDQFLGSGRPTQSDPPGDTMSTKGA